EQLEFACLAVDTESAYRTGVLHFFNGSTVDGIEELTAWMDLKISGTLQCRHRLYPCELAFRPIEFKHVNSFTAVAVTSYDVNDVFLLLCEDAGKRKIGRAHV